MVFLAWSFGSLFVSLLAALVGFEELAGEAWSLRVKAIAGVFFVGFIVLMALAVVGVGDA
jgi:hypothetical protein